MLLSTNFYYNTLEDALQNELKVLIPSSFTIINPETYQSDKITIGISDDNEENDADEAASTQACRSYVFRFANRCIRLIDGPGVGNTRGADHVARTFQHILT